MPDELAQEAENIRPGGWVDRAAFNTLFSKLNCVTPEQVVNLIREGKCLFGDDINWDTWQNTVRRLKLEPYMTRERFLKEFETRRPDIWEAGTREELWSIWADAQIKTLRANLGLPELLPPRKFYRVK
jgi:hypothetical protein